jgi:hypothetical protein
MAWDDEGLRWSRMWANIRVAAGNMVGDTTKKGSESVGGKKQ